MCHDFGGRVVAQGSWLPFAPTANAVTVTPAVPTTASAIVTGEHIRQIYEIYRDWRAEEGLSAVITTEEAARNDCNMRPSRYVASDDVEPPLPLEEALVLLAQAEESRAEADAELDNVLTVLGFGG